MDQVYLFWWYEASPCFHVRRTQLPSSSDSYRCNSLNCDYMSCRTSSRCTNRGYLDVEISLIIDSTKLQRYILCYFAEIRTIQWAAIPNSPNDRSKFSLCQINDRRQCQQSRSCGWIMIYQRSVLARIIGQNLLIGWLTSYCCFIRQIKLSLTV